MLSVTQRIATVSQPQGGFVPDGLFTQTQYEDYQILQPVEIEDKYLLSLQGAAVDYLTRYMLFGDKNEAFHISILGANKLDDAYENNVASSHISELLSQVVGLDDDSIRIACQITGYDVAYRMGIRFYRDVDEIKVPIEMVSNIRIMVNRGLDFLKKMGPVISSELTFEGGYTGLVSSGDGDYLTSEMLIDFKVSKKNFSNKWSLQLLMYYLLGLHSVHAEYKSISSLCVFNPLENKSYTVQLSDIKDETKYKVSHDVIGYKMADDPYGISLNVNYSTWRDVDGTDNGVVLRFMTNRMKLGIKFDVSNYQDGIHKISLNEYWFCLGERDHEYLNVLRPSFRYVDHVLMIKKNGYLMFLSVTAKGRLGVLNGGRFKTATFSAQYYYDNIERYVSLVLTSFSKYWDALRSISKQLKSLSPSEESLRARYSLEKVEYKELFDKDVGTFEEWYKESGQFYRLSGRVHGCIVDIDSMNHIYVNPYDGTITPYYAFSMYDKDVYINVKSLLAEQKPEFLESFEELALEPKRNELSVTNNQKHIVLIQTGDTVSRKTKKVYSHDMYAISNRLKPLQKVYDHKLVQVWYDDILNDDKLLLEDKYLNKPQRKTMKDKYLGQSMMQKGNRSATITEYRNYDDIDIVFEDGYAVRNVNVNRWKRGQLVHPDIANELKQVRRKKAVKTQKISKREKYIGLTKCMNCGLQATVIDYIDCNHITIEFEDGLIKHNVRTDHFINGNVAHEKKNIVKSKRAITTENAELEEHQVDDSITAEKGFSPDRKLALKVHKQSVQIEKRDQIHDYEQVNEPVIVVKSSDDNLSFEEIKQKYKNMKKTMNDGSVVKVVKAVNRRNVMVQFEDGTILKSVSIKRFLSGTVNHP